MGAVLGAIYASRPVGEKGMAEILAYFRRSPFFRRPAKGDGLHRRPGLAGGLIRKLATAGIASAISFRLGLRRANPVEKAIEDFFGAGLTFADLPLPFGVNAVNLTSGEVEDFISGPLAPALKAGVAVGLLFAPFAWRGAQYADAAPICPLPVGLCRRLGAQTVLAVDISVPLENPLACQNGFDVVRRLMSIQGERLNQAETRGADAILKIDVSDIFWGDFSRIDEAFMRGRAAAGAALGRILAATGKTA
jgi:NTE family protein